MSKYRISKHAREDLIAIAQYGDDRYGIQASDAYRDKLIKRFEALAEKPLRYPPVDHIREGYRRSVCGVNSIYFRVDGDDIEIMRILGRQSLNAAFD